MKGKVKTMTTDNSNASNGGIGCLGVIVILVIAHFCDCGGGRARDEQLSRRLDRLQHQVDLQQRR